MQSFVGSFVLNASTGNQAITGVGFQPKIVFFFLNYRTADGSAGGINYCIGSAISSTDRRCMSAEGDDNQTVSGNTPYSQVLDDSKCIRFPKVDHSGGTRIAADFVSMDSGGFTINLGTTDGTRMVVNFLALGGTDLSNVKSGTIQARTTTGNQGYTGIGFQPDGVIFFTNIVNDGTAPPLVDQFDKIRALLGAGTSSSSRFTIDTLHNNNGGSNSICKSKQITTKIITSMLSAGTGTRQEADLVSLDSDGFTLNWSTVDTNAFNIFYVALKGIKISVGAFNQNTSTGNQGVTGVGFQPSSLILLSDNFASSSSIQANARFSLGVTDGTNQGSIWFGSRDAVATYADDINLDRAKTINTLTEVTGGGGNPTLTTSASIVSLDSDGFTINNTTADATSRQILYIAFGSNIASSNRILGGLKMMGVGN